MFSTLTTSSGSMAWPGGTTRIHDIRSGVGAPAVAGVRGPLATTLVICPIVTGFLVPVTVMPIWGGDASQQGAPPAQMSGSVIADRTYESGTELGGRSPIKYRSRAL